MANLQASLRSRSTPAPDDMPRLLQSVNRLLYESTEAERYATLFFGSYHDASRLLHYVNCGHNPPMLSRRDGRVERLEGSAAVLGLFEKWECEIKDVQLAAGDALVIFTDGVTEAIDSSGEELGEARLLEILQANRHLPASSLLSAVVASVHKFSGPEQTDDLTLVVAQVREFPREPRASYTVS